MNSNIEVWLWLLLVLLPHNSRTAEILSTYGSAVEAAKAMRDGTCPLSAAEKQRVERTRTREVRSLMNECERLGIRIITLDDEEYPSLLRNIPDPPIVLFVKGSLAPLKDLPAISVVGPRQPSEYGRKVCDRLCSEMAHDGIAIISGMAVGIDACAHRSAVNNGGYTVAVLGCGITVNYPSENEELKNAVLESGGALISELLPYASVTQGYFKRRNRIIAGISCATLIAEASSRSGALLTAEHALNQKRTLLCVPPQDIFAERFYGLTTLIRSGAKPVCDICDVYSALIASDERAARLRKLLASKEKQWMNALSRNKPIAVKSSLATAAPSEKPAVAKTEEKPPEPDIDISQLDTNEAEIVDLITKGAVTNDDLIEQTGKKYDEICSIILGLEINGIIVRNRDGTFSIA